MHRILQGGGANLSQANHLSVSFKSVLSYKGVWGTAFPIKHPVSIYVLCVVHHLSSLFNFPQFLPFSLPLFGNCPSWQHLFSSFPHFQERRLASQKSLMYWAHPHILAGEGAIGPHVVKRRPVCLKIIDAREILTQTHLRLSSENTHTDMSFSSGLIPREFPHAF